MHHLLMHKLVGERVDQFSWFFTSDQIWTLAR